MTFPSVVRYSGIASGSAPSYFDCVVVADAGRESTSLLCVARIVGVAKKNPANVSGVREVSGCTGQGQTLGKTSLQCAPAAASAPPPPFIGRVIQTIEIISTNSSAEKWFRFANNPALMVNGSRPLIATSSESEN